jgi:hypothetical protein
VPPTAGRPCAAPWRPEGVARHFALALAALLAACQPASDRPALSAVPDGAFGAADPGLLVGTWRCRDLNPYPDQPGQVVTATYAADGGYRAEADAPGRGPMGAIRVVQRGRWSVAGDRVVTSDVVTDARAVDGDTATDAWARAGAQVIDAVTAGRPAESEVLRLDARRLTLRPVGPTDPPVVGCVRGAAPPTQPEAAGPEARPPRGAGAAARGETAAPPLLRRRLTAMVTASMAPRAPSAMSFCASQGSPCMPR